MIVSSSKIETNILLQGLEKQFEITHCNLDYFLGMERTRCSDGSKCLYQTNYANTLVGKFSLLNTKELSSPIDKSHGIKHNLTSDNQSIQAVGNLLFLS